MGSGFLKYIKSAATLVAAITSVICLGACSFIYNAYDFIEKRTGVDVSSCKIVTDVDTHGGFHGDGDHYIEVDCSKKADRISAAVEEWKSLPMTENIGRMVSGVFPTVENGKYLFIDRHDQATDPHDDSELFDRHSFNFIVAVYDEDNCMFYYYGFDT